MGQRIDVNHENIYYGDFLAVEDVNINIEANKVTAFIGPSGCGKSTVLRTLDRMHEIIPGAHCEGEVLLEGKNLYDKDVDPVAVRRDVGMVFQRPNPFPTMSIRENVLAGVKLNNRKISKSDADDLVEWALRGANLWNEVKDRLDNPGIGLSGGQQNPGIPHGENLFQRGDGGKISQMNGTIAFAVCPGDQPLLDIVVDHGGGESLPFVKVDQLPGHIGNDLVHIQRNIRQFLPGSGTLALQALL